MMRATLLLSAALLVGACDKSRSAATARRVAASTDTAFAGVQSRGQVAMGVDQYTSTHIFEPLLDGGRIELQRDDQDSLGRAKSNSICGRSLRASQPATFSCPASFTRGSFPVLKSWRLVVRRFPTRSKISLAAPRCDSRAPRRAWFALSTTFFSFNGRTTMRQHTREPGPGRRAASALFLPMRVRMDWKRAVGRVTLLDSRKVHELLPRRLNQSFPISVALV
jgi:hypothetical protein